LYNGSASLYNIASLSFFNVNEVKAHRKKESYIINTRSQVI